MDPIENSSRFPILSYLMSQINNHIPLISPNKSKSRINTPYSHPSDIENDIGIGIDIDIDINIEQPSDPHHSSLLQRMPRLNEPQLITSMARSISDVTQTRSVLLSLGPRPDHESVDSARSKVAEIQTRLESDLSDVYADDEVRRRREAEREAAPYRAVIQLDEMHEAYEKLLRDAEERLEKIYDSASAKAEDKTGKGLGEGERVSEAVVELLEKASSGKEMERVELRGRELKMIPESIGRIRGVVSLDLSNNQLQAIPDSIAGLENLEELNLSSNCLVSLPDSIGLLFNLKFLNASGNKLKALPDSICCCRSLVELDVSYNDLTYLPTKIGYELVYLQKLFIYLNKIRSLPASICEMKSLRYLDAHFNEIHGLPRAIGKLTNLEVLNLSSNFSDLTELPETIGDLTNLRELDLSNNQIHVLPVTIHRLDKLTKLNLDQNPIVIPPIEVVNKGVEAVKEYMAQMWLEILAEEEQKRIHEASNPSQTGWLSRGSSWLNNLVGGLAGSVSGYLGTTSKSHGDPYLDQQL